LAKHYDGMHFNDLEQLTNHIIGHHTNATVLIKGSRMVRLDQLVERLQK